MEKCIDCGVEISDGSQKVTSSGDVCCKNCFEANYVVCSRCKSIVDLCNSTKWGDDLYMCNNCRATIEKD